MPVEISKNGGTAFTDRESINFYQACVLKAGLRMYVNAKIIPNRQWTPTNMLQLATHFTKKPYKRGQHDMALADITAWVEAARPTLQVVER